MQYPKFECERLILSDEGRSNRTPFERDRARILHSAALRRLGTKTQIMGANYDDFVRTRLTHSLEVAQVGRDIANQLGTDPNVVDAACLAHDLGHPPFGHNGETALNEIASDIGGFEGNAQTFRILTRLESKVFAENVFNVNCDNELSYGLNLTRATLDAVCKYPWKKSEISGVPGKENSNKFNIYDDDYEYFKWVRNRRIGEGDISSSNDGRYSKCIEAQIMDLSDDISYSTHDIEDALTSGVMNHPSLAFVLEKKNWQHLIEVNRSWYKDAFNNDELEEAVSRLKQINLFSIEFDGSRRSSAALKNMTSSLIGRFCQNVTNATIAVYSDTQIIRYNANLVIPREVEAEIHLLKIIAAAFVMNPINRSESSQNESDIIHNLSEMYLKKPRMLDTQFKIDFDQAQNDSARLRVIVDQIASLTDISAKLKNNSVLRLI